jgi:uncharacterized protein
MLTQIAQGEEFLRSLGFKEVRLRHHGTIARIEIAKENLSSLTAPEVVKRIGVKMKELGFLFVGLDAGGYRTGIFNESI